MNWHGQHLTGEREKVREGNLDVVTFEFAIGKNIKKLNPNVQHQDCFGLKKNKESYFIFPLLIITN